MGEVSRPLLRMKGAVIGLARELYKSHPDINILCLLVIQYLYSFDLPCYCNAAVLSKADALQLYGPVYLRDNIRVLQKARNIVAHSMYTQLYNAKVLKNRDIIIYCAQCILDYEVARNCATTASEQDDLLRQFWGTQRSVETLQ